jgi:N-acetyl-alpha-D-muramate 1-phosphate uridylyltransferase
MLPIVILAGGFGTRLGSLTENTPKCLLKVNQKPFIELQLELLREAGYSQAFLCLSHYAEKVIEHVGNGKRFGMNIEYSLDGSDQLGTGGAIRKVLPKLGPEFALIYGDSYLPIDYKTVEDAFLDSGAPGLITVFENKNQLDVSNVEFFNNKVKIYSKKPSETMSHIDYGLSYLRSEVFEPYEIDKQFDLALLLSRLSIDGKLAGFEVFERFFEIGSTKGIEELSSYLKEIEK